MIPSGPASMRRAMFAVLVAAMLLGSTACGLRIVYNNLDRVATWFVAEMLALDRQQRRELRAAAADLLDWHRHQQLPEYLAFIAELSGRVGSEITSNDIARWRARIERWYAELAEASLPIAVVTLRDLRPEQIELFAGNLADYAAEAEDADAGRSPAERRETWRKETARGFAERIGRLSAEQRELIAAASDEWQPDAAAWAQFRRTWQADLVALLRARPPIAEFTRALRALWVDATSRRPGTLGDLIAHNDAVFTTLVVDVLATLSDDQRHRLSRNLAALERDLQSLTAPD